MQSSNRPVLLISLALTLAAGSVVTAISAPPPLPFKTETTRREISPDKPVLLIRFSHVPPLSMKEMTPREGLAAFLDLIPQDVRKYCVIIAENDLDLLNDCGFYFVSHSVQYKEGSELEDLYRKYEYYIGTTHGELGPGTLDTTFKFLPRNLDLAKKYGGYLIWQIQGRGRVLPEWSARFPEGARMMRESGGRVIMLNRNNGIVQTRENISELLGAWQSGVIAQWGFDHQTFQWGYESGLTRMFGEESFPRVNPMCFLGAYPEALFGIEMLETAALGGTVYYWEHEAQIVYSPDYKALAPEFRYVFIPLLRKMINERLISTKEQVQAQTPVAILRKSATGGRNATSLFRNLYGHKYDDSAEWLPYSGRYLRLPFLLDGMTTDADKALYKTVVDNSGTNQDLAVWPTQAEKVAWFNRQFKPVGRGSAWFVHLNDRWYVANPWINHNINADFELPLSSAAAACSVSGVFEPHTLGIVREQADGLRIHLNNYRIDKEALFWPMYSNETRTVGMKMVDYRVLNSANPPDKALRDTVIHLNGVASEPKMASIASEPGFERPFTHTTNWDLVRNRYTIRVRHNGPVDLAIDTKGVKRLPPPGDLALEGMATASSYATIRTIPDMAMDGNDRSSRWEARNQESGVRSQKSEDGSGEWLQVEFEEKKTVSRVVLKEYLDRITAYRIDCWNGTNWTEVAASGAGTPSSRSPPDVVAAKVHDFQPVTAQKVRVVVTTTQTDSYGFGNSPSLYALEVYGTEPGVGLPYDAIASDIYEAEEDAILSPEVERNTSAISNRMYTFNNGYIRFPESGKPFARFLVNAAESGAYRLGLRYSRAEWVGTGDGMLSLYVNGELARTTSLPQTKSWNYWNLRPELVALKQGLNVVEYRNDYGDFGVCVIDHLQVTHFPEGKVEPIGQPYPKPELSPLVRDGRRYEAEEGQLVGGATNKDNEVVHSGGGYAVLGAAAGQSVTLTVPADRDGYHAIGLRYAFPGGNGASFSGWLNGKLAYRYNLPAWLSNSGQGAKLAVRPEGKWGMKVLPYWLRKGENKIVLRVDPGTSGGVYIDCAVVGPTDEGFIAPTQMTLTNAMAVPLRGGDHRLIPTVRPETSCLQDLIWESQDPTLVTVDQNGYVRGLKPGRSMVTVRLVGGGPLSAACSVSVSGDVVNIAPEAMATASAGDPRKAIDGQWARELGPDSGGRPVGDPNWLYGDVSNAWTTGPLESVLKGKKPWIRLEWKEPRTVDRVVLYGPAFANSWSEAVLSDSAGGSIKLGPIAPAGGAPLEIPFTPSATLEWIRLDIVKQSKWSHAGNGVGEIEVYGK